MTCDNYDLKGNIKISCGASLRMKHRPKRNWGGLCCNVYDWKWQGLGLEKMSDSRLSFKGNAIRIYPFTNRKEVSLMMFDWTTLSLTVTKTHRYVYHETRTWGPSRGNNIYMYMYLWVTFSHIYIYIYTDREIFLILQSNFTQEFWRSRTIAELDIEP